MYRLVFNNNDSKEVSHANKQWDRLFYVLLKDKYIACGLGTRCSYLYRASEIRSASNTVGNGIPTDSARTYSCTVGKLPTEFDPAWVVLLTVAFLFAGAPSRISCRGPHYIIARKKMHATFAWHCNKNCLQHAELGNGWSYNKKCGEKVTKKTLHRTTKLGKISARSPWFLFYSLATTLP